MDTGQEVSGGFVIAGCNGSVLLELAVEVFDEVACLVLRLVIGALDLPIALWRDDRFFTCREQRLDDAFVGIKSLVCQQGIGLHLRQKCVGAFQIMGLAGRQEEGQRISERIDHGMDFGAQSAFAAPDRLVFAIFF